jgi:hypothetical protein
MTVDHIKPKSKGGTKHLFNTQPMCTICNGQKQNNFPLIDKFRYYRNLLVFKFKTIINKFGTFKQLIRY